MVTISCSIYTCTYIQESPPRFNTLYACAASSEPELGFPTLHVGAVHPVLLVLISPSLHAVGGRLPVEPMEDVHVLPRDAFLLPPLGGAPRLLQPRLRPRLLLFTLGVEAPGPLMGGVDLL